jgi:hypothetical protein
LSGFGSLGITKADNENIGLRDSIAHDGTFVEWSVSQVSRFGLQLNYQFSDRLSSAIQLSKHQHTESLSEIVHWAYLDFDITPSLSLRLGRMGQDIFMVSDHRDIGFTQVWAHTPNEFYNQLSSEFKDGIQLRYKKPLGDGQLFSKFSATKSDSETVNNGSEDELAFSPNFDFSIEWENQTWRLHLSHSFGKAKQKNDVNELKGILNDAAALGWTAITPFIDDFDLNDNWIRYYGLGLSYQKSGWIVQTEMNRTEAPSEFFSKMSGGYVLVGKRLDKLTPFVMLAKAKSDRVILPSAPFYLSPLQNSLQEFVDYLPIEQKTLSLGLRWDIRHNIALKAQWDRTWVEPFGSYLYDVIDSQSESETLDRYTFTVDFVF